MCRAHLSEIYVLLLVKLDFYRLNIEVYSLLGVLDYFHIIIFYVIFIYF